MEKVIITLASEWSRVHDVHVVSLFENGSDGYDIPEKTTLHSLKLDNQNFVSKVKTTLRAFWEFRRLVRKYQADCILSFVPTYNIFSIVSSFGMRPRVYISDRNNLKRFNSKLVYWLRKVFYPMADGIIAQTRLAQMRMSRQVYHKNIKVIPNPVDIEKFSVGDDSRRKKIVVSIGRLVPGKGLEDLIEVFDRLHDRHPDWILQIAGTGPLETVLRREIASRYAETYIRLSGPTQNPEHLLHEASIFAFTSYAEGLPNALCEALCTGIACVSYDCDAGPADLIEPNINGILLPVGDKEALAENLDKLMRNPQLRTELGKHAQRSREWLNQGQIGKEFLSFMFSENKIQE